MLADLIRSCLSHRVTILATATNLSSFEPSLFQARGASIFCIKLQLPVLDQVCHSVLLVLKRMQIKKLNSRNYILEHETRSPNQIFIRKI